MNYQTILIDKETVQEVRDNNIGVVCNNACKGVGSTVVDNYIKDCKCLKYTYFKREET